MKLDGLKNKRILILGFGREGKDTLRFLRKLFPKKVIGVADKNSEFKKQSSKLVRWYLGEDYLKAIKGYDVVIRSPGIPPKIIAPFIAKRQKITSQTEIFLENCPGKIIGVTGTKGKGTTSSLIYQILKEGGLKAHLVGNIGKPALNLLFSATRAKRSGGDEGKLRRRQTSATTKKDIYVYEMSSHQLWGLKKSPQVAVFLNISQAHLDYFKNFKDYITAKRNIAKYQKRGDFLIYNSRDKVVRKIAKKSKAKKIPILTKLRISTNIQIPLVGKFNLQNVMAAVAVGKIFVIPDTIIGKAIKNFKPLPHRLELVGIYKGIKFYDDSAATVPEAARYALIALGKKAQTIILGGHDSKVDYTPLAKEIAKSKIKNLIFFPPSGKRIWGEIKKMQKQGVKKVFFANNMRKAVKFAFEHTLRNRICLLSPASPSFGVFKDYKQRGNLFQKYVKLYAR